MRKKEKIAQEIIDALIKHGFEAYLAGGCVRDILLGIDPKDYDIITNARPEEIEKVFPRTIPVGKQFGVILAIVGGHHFEVATFRSDAGYSDSRRPDAVFFTSAKEDAKRRDFTINGLFAEKEILNIKDPKEAQKFVVDYVDGINDLNKKIVRFIGNPEKRIKEDNLRILRAIRFKNNLNFNYDPLTWKSICKNTKLILNVSWERIRDEINKAFLSPNRLEFLEDLNKSKILKYILPEIENLKGVKQPPNLHAEGDVFVHTFLCAESLPEKSPLYLIWGILFHDIGKPQTFEIAADRIRFHGHTKVSVEIAQKIMKRLRFSNKEKTLILWLVKNHHILSDIPKMKKAKQRRWLIHPDFPKLLELHRIDALGSLPNDLSLYKALEKMYQKELKKPKPIQKLLSGNEIMKHFKISSGPLVGKLLLALEEAQLEEKVKTKKQGYQFLEKVIKRLK